MNVVSIIYDVSLWMNATCDSPLDTPVALIALTESPVTDGTWTQSTGSITVPAGVGSMQLFVDRKCSTFTCADGAPTNFDDVCFGPAGACPAVTAVTFRSFAARRTREGVLVTWRTASEVDTLGFNVYRERNGHRVRVNSKLIAAKASGGRSYSYLDRRAPTSGPLRFRVRVVNLDGSRTWYGPAEVRA